MILSILNILIFIIIKSECNYQGDFDDVRDNLTCFISTSTFCSETWTLILIPVNKRGFNWKMSITMPEVMSRIIGWKILVHGTWWFCICDSTCRKVPVVRRLDFELWGCKVKISQNIVPKSILRFHILWHL